MRHVRLILITGLPASGKTTLGRVLAQRYAVPLLAKDSIKEPLMDVLAAPDAAASRKLSDASFAVLFATARELLAARVSLILEGNFRAGEHEAPLRALLEQNGPETRVAALQILCRVSEAERVGRLTQRAHDPARHAGHRDPDLTVSVRQSNDAFLSIEAQRLLYDAPGTLQAVDHWWHVNPFGGDASGQSV